MRLQHEEYRHFRTAIAFCFGIIALLAIFLLIYGKNKSFLLINGSYSIQADYFFNYVTLLGEWFLWVPLFAYAIFYKRDFFIAVITALIISTILTRLGKQVFFEGQPRPLRLLEDLARAVPILKHNNYVNSFPSGHTSTAFTTALLLAFIVRKKFAIYVFPLIAFLVGYSRVYLAQHFVTDVLAGTIVGMVASYLALVVYEQVRKKKRVIEEEPSP